MKKHINENYINVIIINNNPLTLKPIVGHSLPADCWPPFHLSTDRGKRLSCQFRGDMWSVCEDP